MSSEDGTNISPERRAAPRLPVTVYFTSGNVEGTGFIRDISQTGAQIRFLKTSGQLDPEMTVDLLFSNFSNDTDEAPLGARGRVVRSTPKEFAVEFVQLDERVQDLLIAALTRGAALATKG